MLFWTRIVQSKPWRPWKISSKRKWTSYSHSFSKNSLARNHFPISSRENPKNNKLLTLRKKLLRRPKTLKASEHWWTLPRLPLGIMKSPSSSTRRVSNTLGPLVSSARWKMEFWRGPVKLWIRSSVTQMLRMPCWSDLVVGCFMGRFIKIIKFRFFINY